MNTYKKAKTELEPLKTSHRNRRYTQSLTCPKGLQTSIKIILRDVKRKYVPVHVFGFCTVF
jgi:hypothetical protein